MPTTDRPNQNKIWNLLFYQWLQKLNSNFSMNIFQNMLSSIFTLNDLNVHCHYSQLYLNFFLQMHLTTFAISHNRLASLFLIKIQRMHQETHALVIDADAPPSFYLLSFFFFLSNFCLSHGSTPFRRFANVRWKLRHKVFSPLLWHLRTGDGDDEEAVCFPKCEDIKVTDSDPLPPIRLSYQSACTFGVRR